MTRPSSVRRALRAALAWFTISLLAAPLLAQADWPQWRGADGLASSSATGLPTELGPDSSELLWSVAVPGEGHSSPIVSDGKVFVTTAYPGGESVRAVKRFGIAGLVLLALLTGLLSIRRRAREPLAPGAERLRWLQRLDSLAIGATSLGFAAAALATTFRPDLFWPPGQPGHIWFFTGTIGLAGLAAGFGWFRPSSRMRLLAVPVLLACAVLLALYIPPNRYKGPFKPEYRAVMAAPGVGLALWYALTFFLSRRATLRRPLLNCALGALSLAAASALLFLVYNRLEPRAGYVRALVAYELDSGKELWKSELFEASAERKYPTNTYATPTPCADGERVFAWFGAGYACTDYDGRVLWKGVDEQYAPHSRYGASSSPVLFEDSVIVSQDNELQARDSFLMSLERATGEVSWRVEPKDSHDGYSTPLLMPRGDGFELIIATQDFVHSYDPRSGGRLWSLPLAVKQIVPSLCYAGDDLLLVAGGTHLEFSTTGLRLEGIGKATKPEVLWDTRRAVPGISSPVLAGGCYFTVSDGGILSCIDPETGKTHWKERLGGNYWSSLVAGDGRVFASNDEGLLTQVAAAPEFQVLGTAEFGAGIYATPAIVDGHILVRTTGRLYCFGAR